MKKIYFLLFCAAITACARDGDILPPFNPGDLNDGSLKISLPVTVLGNKLENPYSVSNMRLALESLSPEEAAGLSVDDISTSHLYVKFKPKNDEELDLLKTDSTLMLYDFPLDYEILEPGEYYHDPEIPDSLPTYQYASVPFSQRSAVDALGVEYEVLENLFIPDEDKDFVENSETRAVAMRLDASVADALVDRALELTGNAEEPLVQTRASKWRPAGRIQYESTLLGLVGLEGIKVKARRWFTTHTGITNSNGYYSCDGRFRRPANYSFDWERYHFEVRRNQSLAKYDGPKKRGNWDVKINKDQQQAYYRATIFRAAYHYYYKDIGGLRRPPQNSFWRTQLKIQACYETNDDKNGNTKTHRRFLGLGSIIKIYNPQRAEDEIYATTIHELAHAAHWRMIVKEPGTNRYRDYHFAEEKMTESWPCGVQYYLTRMTYPNYKGRLTNSTYTNVVIDLIDTPADDGKNRGKSYVEGDKVQGYTMSQIESALIGCDTWIKWRNKIKNYNNATKQYVDELFAAW